MVRSLDFPSKLEGWWVGMLMKHEGGGVLVTVEAGPSASKDPGHAWNFLLEVIGKGR